MSATGIDIQMITYQEGAATAVQNAAGGFIQGVTVSLAEARSFIESGDLICLGAVSYTHLEKDLVLIVDEVQTGVGRTGTFLCCEHYNLCLLYTSRCV